MQTRTLVIEKKRKATSLGVVSPFDFKVRDGGAIDPQILLKNPNMSLYCLDFENRKALFVETPPECDLSRAPFVYQTQYEAATRLVQAPYETLHRLAADVVIDPSRLILIYSVGRCGSTLVSHAFNQIEGVDSLSEPDVFTQMLTIWERGGKAVTLTGGKAALLKSCMLLQCASGRIKGATAWALKFRSDVMRLWPMFYWGFPKAKVVFLYRHAESWARSMWRAMQALPVSFPWVSDPLTPLDELDGRTSLEYLALGWLSTMQQCREMQRQGIPLFVVRYEELNAAPRDVLCQMFAYCGLAENPVGNLDTVLEQDAQEGTMLSRERLAAAPVLLTAEHLAKLRRLIQADSPGWAADTILSGTYFPPIQQSDKRDGKLLSKGWAWPARWLARKMRHT